MPLNSNSYVSLALAGAVMAVAFYAGTATETIAANAREIEDLKVERRQIYLRLNEISERLYKIQAAVGVKDRPPSPIPPEGFQKFRPKN